MSLLRIINLNASDFLINFIFFICQFVNKINFDHQQKKSILQLMTKYLFVENKTPKIPKLIKKLKLLFEVFIFKNRKTCF